MLNQVILVGRLTQTPKIKEKENNTKYCELTLAVKRSYKDINGEYQTDFITCLLWGGISQTTKEYCKQGDLIGIKGKIETQNKKVVIVAEKVTFLSTRKEE